jgi:hypothetical protein
MADRVEASDSDEYSAASRKRKRSASVGGMDSPKRLRRTSSDLSKIWLCEIDDCDKRFKSVSGPLGHYYDRRGGCSANMTFSP